MSDQESTCSFDLERMKKALAGPLYELPRGLTHEEIREAILKTGRGEGEEYRVVDTELTNKFLGELNE